MNIQISAAAPILIIFGKGEALIREQRLIDHLSLCTDKKRVQSPRFFLRGGAEGCVCTQANAGYLNSVRRSFSYFDSTTQHQQTKRNGMQISLFWDGLARTNPTTYVNTIIGDYW